MTHEHPCPLGHRDHRAHARTCLWCQALVGAKAASFKSGRREFAIEGGIIRPAHHREEANR